MFVVLYFFVCFCLFFPCCDNAFEIKCIYFQIILYFVIKYVNALWQYALSLNIVQCR